ncbi:hypothetical protein AB1Y20_018754 [Prymnesium parvum]|uniref:FAD/NAD(P)-binding domain-containing protein n=1 Tax=Prymnesium parvum TaxID=97485 RepID=A0AB34JPG5_PRYPA
MSGPPPPPPHPPPVSTGACADDLTCAAFPPSNLPVPGFITTRRGGKRKVEAAVTNPKPPPPKCDTRGQAESPPKRQTRAQAKAEAQMSQGCKEAAHVASVPSDRRGGPLTEAPSPSGETKDILDSFACLLNEAGAKADLGPEMLETLSSKLASSLNFSQSSLFKKLGERSQWMQYKKRRDSTERKQLRILVVGAGPIGLRCAIELALLGHFVHVLEKRHSFTRLNVLHLWEFVEYDLIELGIKLLDPSVFASVDYQHVGTSQLQHSLLKVALLLGVQVDLGAPVSDLHSLRDLASSGSFVKAIPSGGAAGDVNFDVLVDGTGARCDFFSSIGFEQELVLKGARAIGIVVHFHNRKTAMELQLREANWAHQFWTTR